MKSSNKRRADQIFNELRNGKFPSRAHTTTLREDIITFSGMSRASAKLKIK